jgi:hypothetical protein
MPPKIKFSARSLKAGQFAVVVTGVSLYINVTQWRGAPAETPVLM